MPQSETNAGYASRVYRGGYRAMVGRSEATQALLRQIEQIAGRSATVLIEGETGVGKEVAAREIHARSERAARPFVPADCTAFSEQLIESQLFGHVRGAFTGAVASTLGMLRSAHQGTLFLDEIGELPLGIQAKLLRCVQERTVIPVGGIEPIGIDVRIVAATHRDLSRMVREGSFRQDLYYRINVVRLTIRPLRERPDDVVALASHFLDEFARCYAEPGKTLMHEAQDLLLQYAWPGNVRELRNAMERAFLYCNGLQIGIAHLPAEVCTRLDAGAGSSASGSEATLSLAEAERMLIARVLKFSAGNQSQAARLLRVERHRLRRLIVRHGLAHLLSTPGR